jgi:flagellar biosynthesis/type III secretory pathway protein FliH
MHIFQAFKETSRESIWKKNYKRPKVLKAEMENKRIKQEAKNKRELARSRLQQNARSFASWAARCYVQRMSDFKRGGYNPKSINFGKLPGFSRTNARAFSMAKQIVNTR